MLLLFYARDTLQAQSYWSTNSTENDSIAVFTSNQTSPVIVRDGADGAIIVWEDSRNTSTGVDILAARIGASGRLVWNTQGVPVSSAANSQLSPVMVEDGAGGAFIAWQDGRSVPTLNIFAQRIEPLQGLGLWQPDGVRVQQGSNALPVIIRDGIVGTFIGSYSAIQANFVIYLQKVNLDGATQWPSFNQPSQGMRTPLPACPPAIASDFVDGLIAVWPDNRNQGVLPEVYASRLDSDGSPAWTEDEIVISSTISERTDPFVIPNGSGGAIIGWIQPESVGSTDDRVLLQNINSSGQILWAQNGVVVSQTSGSKRNLRLLKIGNTIFALWETLNQGADWDIAAQRVDTLGVNIGVPIVVSNAPGDQVNPVVISNGRDNLIVTWEDDQNALTTDTDIYAQLIRTNGSTRWGTSTTGRVVTSASGPQRRPALTDDGLGGAIIVWEDARSGVDLDIYAQRVGEPGNLGEFRTITITDPNPDTIWEIGGRQTITWSHSGEIDSISIELSRDGGATYQDVIAMRTANTGSFEVAVVGPTSSAGKIRIRAIGASFVTGLSDETFVIGEPQGPEIVAVDTVTQGTFNDAIEITSIVTDNSGVESVFLRYREGGEAVFDSLAMVEIAPDTFRQSIPASVVQEQGAEYRIRGVDTIGLSSESAPFFVSVSFGVTVQGNAVSAGSSQNSYRMISSPNILDDPSAASVFEASGFGAYDTTSWRLWQYRSNTNVEFDTVNASSFIFSPGQAYWLISSRDRTVTFGAGETLSAANPWAVTLEPGWNQVGNPFAFPVAWVDVLAASNNATVSDPFSFSGSYSTAQVIDPYAGYFVFNRGPGQVTLFFPPVSSVSPNSSEKRISVSDEAGWDIQLGVSCKHALDHANFLGIRERANNQWDRFDQPEPPTIGEFVSLYFPRTDWPEFPNNYTSEFRAEISQGQIWTFTVLTNIGGTEARIEVSGIERVPAEYQILLIDEKLNVRQDLRRDNQYGFPTGARGTTKHLKLLIGNAGYLASEVAGYEFIPEDFQLSQNYPNPFNPVTSIRYGLPEASPVNIKIYDLLGREVRTLVDNESQEAGFHIVSWNGTDRFGKSAASGVYIYRLVAGDFTQTRKMVLVR